MPKDTPAVPDTTPIVPDANAQAKAALPQPELAKPWENEPELPSAPPTSKIGKAYQGMKDWLSEHEQHLSEEYLAPFRAGLDKMAGETEDSPTVKAASPTAQGVAKGVAGLMRAVPVGKNVSETIQANIVPPELEELGVKLHPEQIIKDAGLVYKGELTKGSGVHMFEHPDNPGMTAALHESEFTPEKVQKKMQSKLDEFKAGEKPVYAYRARSVGEEGVPADSRSHAHATLSEDEAHSYVPGRESATGKPQEVIKFRLDKMKPEHYDRKAGPGGSDWVKLNKAVPESAVEKVKSKAPESKEPNDWEKPK